MRWRNCAGPVFEPIEILRRLLRHEIDFVIVGGIAGSLAGSPVTTLDLDLVYRIDEDNVRRLAAALAEMNAIYKDPAGRRIEPDADRLARYQVNLLRTSLGDLDLLQSIGNDLRYDKLVLRTVAYELDGLHVRAIDLPTLIEAKTIANRPKDLYALPYLRRLLHSPGEKDKG